MSLDWLKKATVETALAAVRTVTRYSLDTYEPHLANEASGRRPLNIKNAGGRIQILWNLDKCEIHTDLPTTVFPFTATADRGKILAPRKGGSCVYGMRIRGSYVSSETVEAMSLPVVRPKGYYGKAALRITNSTLCLELPAGEEGLESLPWFSVQLDNYTTRPAAMLLVDRTGETDCLVLLTGCGTEHVRKSGVSAFEALMIEDCAKPWVTYSSYEDLIDDTAYKAIRTWNAMKSYRLPGKPWYRYDHLYRHWAVPKNGKSGYRLISAPRGGLKTEASKIHQRLSENPVHTGLGLAGDGLENTLSYKPGVDYVKELAERGLSIENAGRYCLQIDLKDFFTNLQPCTLFELIDSVCTYAEFDRLLMEAAPLLGFVKTMTKASKKTYTSNHRVRLGLLELYTAQLPLWKRELGGFDLEACDGAKTRNGAAKHDSVYRQLLIKPDDFSRIAELHREVAPYVPITQRGVPQGAAFSVDIANLAASILTHNTVSCLKSILQDFGAEDSVESVIYSDNIYLFYNAPADFRNILRREIPIELKRRFSGAKIGNMVKPWKILNFDREKADVKLLGLILDRNGDIRLSRRYRRKINQSIIHAGKGEKGWGQAEEGRKNWYLHVKAYTNGNYSRGLVDGSEPRVK